MTRRKIYLLLASSIMLSLFISCASIVTGGFSEITIGSNRDIKKLEIVETTRDLKVYNGTLNSKETIQVTLSRSYSYNVGNIYRFYIYQEDDTKPTVFEMKLEKASFWYSWGNVIFLPFAFVGWYYVDPVTGAKYKWSEPVAIEGVTTVESNVRSRKRNTINFIFD